MGATLVACCVVACSLGLDGFTSDDAGVDASPPPPGPPGVDAPSDAPPAADASDAPPPDAGCGTPTTGLLAHYSMDPSAVMGTRVVDSSGHGNDATLVGFPASPLTPGRFGDALAFPTTSAYVDVPSTLAFDTSPGGVNTISLWFYRGSSPAVDDVLVYFPPDPRYDLWLTGDGNLCINTGNYDCWGIQDATLLDRWVHVVAVLANGPTTGGELWVNGVKRTLSCPVSDGGFQPCTASRTIAPPYSLGGRTDFFFHGRIDEARFYSRRLDPSEIAALAACP